MPTWLGIDVGVTAVKVAMLRSTYRKTALVALTAVDVAEAGGTVEAIRAAVSSAVTASGAKPGTVADGVAACIDGSRAAFRTLTLPASAAKALSDVLVFELESLVPFELSDAVFDYRIIQADRSEKDQLHTIAAVARIDDVRSRIDLVKRAIQMEPERIGVGAFPLANLVPLVPQLAEEGPIVVIDLGTRSSEVLVLQGGEPVFGRTLSFGTAGLPATANKLAREIRVTIAAFRSAGGPAPTRVLLCGGGAFVSGAEGFLAAELELPVEVMATPALEMTGVDPERVRELPRFAKAVGLALGIAGRPMGLNLRKGPLSYERGFAWVREKVPVLAGLAAVILVSFVFSGWAKLHATSKEREALEGALATVSKEVLGEETNSAERAQELLQQQSAQADEDPMPHADAFDVMVKLSEDIPENMTHDIEELDVQKGHVSLHGVVGSIPDAQTIQSTLRNERCFQDVKMPRTNQVVGGDRQKYVIEFDVKCPEDVKTPPKKKSESASPSASASTGGK